jgi:hypothetical protein
MRTTAERVIPGVLMIIAAPLSIDKTFLDRHRATAVAALVVRGRGPGTHANKQDQQKVEQRGPASVHHVAAGFRISVHATYRQLEHHAGSAATSCSPWYFPAGFFDVTFSRNPATESQGG